MNHKIIKILIINGLISDYFTEHFKVIKSYYIIFERKIKVAKQSRYTYNIFKKKIGLHMAPIN